MRREEVVAHLLQNGCVVRKEKKNGMWVMYRPETDILIALPATDPARAGNICRICEDLGIPLPDDPEIHAEKKKIDSLRQRINFGQN